jgi:glycosyltransferase involved in cell wall biosynthesis
VFQLARLLRRERVDVAQTHLFEPSTVGLLAARAAGTRLRVVTRHHSDFTTTFRKPIHRRVDRWHAMTSDRVMAASEAVKRAMVRYEGVPEDRIVVARYGYDFEALRPRLTPGERSRLRRSAGGGRRVLVGTVARLSVEKGHDDLLRAIPAVLRHEPDACFVLIGAGPLRADLERAAERLGVGDHVRFLGWRSDAHALIEAMDVIVHPSLHEAFSSAIIEAMALERPVVSTDVAAAPEQIDHGETGLLVPPRDPDALAAGLVELLRDPARAAAIGREARRRAVQRLSFPRVMRDYENFYDHLISGSH